MIDLPTLIFAIVVSIMVSGLVGYIIGRYLK
jgi:hypothetical protein